MIIYFRKNAMDFSSALLIVANHQLMTRQDDFFDWVKS